MKSSMQKEEASTIVPLWFVKSKKAKNVGDSSYDEIPEMDDEDGIIEWGVLLFTDGGIVLKVFQKGKQKG